MLDLHVTEHFAPNNDGWLLHLKQTVVPERFDPLTRPVVIVPGYGMNAFIFGFHPRGTSMERCIAEAGFEVWSVNLRGQGPSRPVQDKPPIPSLRSYAEIDLTAALDWIAARTQTQAETSSVIGCSLGGSIAYAHMALRDDHRMSELVTIGSPLRWKSFNPILRFAFSRPQIVGMVKITGARRIARRAFPLLGKTPLLNIYMNSDHVDMSAADELTQTVEDPIPRVNKDIAKWMRDADLKLRNVNITEALRGADLPLLIVASNRDGIVPTETTLSPLDVWNRSKVDVVRVGDDDNWFAHADLFIANDAPDLVFAPITEWLHTRR